MVGPDVGTSDALQKNQPETAVIQRVDDGLHPRRLDNYHERRGALNRTEKVLLVPLLGGQSSV
jgi:hypothetical protein